MVSPVALLGGVTLTLSDTTLTVAGILLLSVTAVEFGGTFMLRIVRGSNPVTDVQRAFFRAGHAHAGMFVTLALVSQVFVDAAGLSGLPQVLARQGIAAAAILLPAGFFLSVVHPGATAPNRLVWLIHVGVVTLGAGVVALGTGLLLA